MAKRKSAAKEIPTDEQIASMTEERLDQFIAEHDEMAAAPSAPEIGTEESIITLGRREQPVSLNTIHRPYS